MVIGGIVTATLLTLCVLPTVYPRIEMWAAAASATRDNVRRMKTIQALLVVAAGWAPIPVAAQDALQGPPPGDGPLEVAIGLEIIDIVDINSDEQTIEVEAILTMGWKDPRLAFDPDEAGVERRIYQGDFQFAERFDGWWPMLVMRNESGRYERQGVIIKVEPDGSVSYVEEFQALAEVGMDLRRIPFDRQRFRLVFEVMGFGGDQVRLVPDPERTGIGQTTLQQWSIEGVEGIPFDSDVAYLADVGGVSAVSFEAPAARSPKYFLRLVIYPIMILVALSWSVFWMDTESLGSRMDITFIAILTVVAFQIVIGERLPRISYFTILSSFMYANYLILAAGAIVNLRVATLDKHGRVEAGNRLDLRCRWLFPLSYFAGLLLIVGYYFIRH